MIRRALSASAVAALLLALLPLAAHAQGGRLPVRVETIVLPDTLRLGETVSLTWRIWLPKGSTATFPARPPEDSLHHWLAWSTETKAPKGEYREHRLVARFQTFALGTVAVPGPPVRFRIPGEEPRDGAFPRGAFTVVATVPQTGPEPPLKDIHGLVPPPWWATVPWLWIAIGLVALALAVFLVRRLLRRKPKPVRAAPEAPLEPAEVEAKRRLAALVARALPEAGRTYEHGTELADLLRRFVERRFAETARPGDTTGELARRLSARGDIEPPDAAALRGILEACDLTKFARRPYDAIRAHEAEAVAGRLLDRWTPPAAVGAPAAPAVPQEGAA